MRVMRKVIISERQFKRLIESLILNEPSSIRRYQTDTISTQTPIEDESGELEYTKSATSDEVGDMLTPQSWRGCNRSIYGRS
mgnify:CR=1 FL=1